MDPMWRSDPASNEDVGRRQAHTQHIITNLDKDYKGKVWVVLRDYKEICMSTTVSLRR